MNNLTADNWVDSKADPWAVRWAGCWVAHSAALTDEKMADCLVESRAAQTAGLRAEPRDVLWGCSLADYWVVLLAVHSVVLMADW